MHEFDSMSAHTLREQIISRNVSPVELTRHALDRAEATQKTLNAFCIIDHEGAMRMAKHAEDCVRKGETNAPLLGLPVSVKDLIAVKDLPYNSGSLTAVNNISSVDAPSVTRLRDAGAVIIGKTTTSEFGCKPLGDSPLTGITRNPWNLDFSPGGSSAGAAASVADGITPFALGTDGGGSLRIPAALCGLVGFKASFGRVPVWPASATPTLAHVGSLARNVEDAVLLTKAVSGADRKDPFSINGKIPDLKSAQHREIKGMRVAWSPTLGYAHPETGVIDIAYKAVQCLEDAGAEVEEVESIFDSDPVDLWMSEFYAGVGTRLRPFLEEKRHLLDPVVASFLDEAMRQTLRDYYESVFKRYALRESARKTFEKYDLVVSPTLPVSKIEVGRNVPTGFEHRNALSWVYYTYPFNLTGQPAMSLYAGTHDGMPVGVQLVSKLWAEEDIVSAATVIERQLGTGTDARRSAGRVS